MFLGKFILLEKELFHLFLSRTDVIISKDDLKKTLTEISREITQTVIIQLRAETQPARELMTLAQTAEYLQCSISISKKLVGPR